MTKQSNKVSSVASNAFSQDDERFMCEALALARNGEATTQPNPRVGCVIVKNGDIVGRGYHSKAGEPHAEREALKDAGNAARNATAYVNLEPCCHQGRTPRCTDGLIDAGINRVVAAMPDPNPLVAGGGFELLRMAGIEVQSGLCEEDARWLNRGFIKRMRESSPWVILKSAATLDGRTAAQNGESQWITGETARSQVQALRAASSAVITGIGTVLSDDPQLNVRIGNAIRQPMRVILDSNLRIPLDAKILGDNVLIFTHSNDDEKIAALLELGVEIVQMTREDTTDIDLSRVLAELAQWQCNQVLVEAGQTLSGAFLAADLVDELVLFYGGSLLGDQGKAMFALPSPVKFAKRPEFTVRACQYLSGDVRVDAVKPQSLRNL